MSADGDVRTDVDVGEGEPEPVNTSQSSVMSDPESFINKISSFFNQPTLSDVRIEVRLHQNRHSALSVMCSVNSLRLFEINIPAPSLMYMFFIKVGEKVYFAHKFVLAQSSDVLRTMLYEERWADTQAQSIRLSETDDCRSVFEPFLKFLYTASVELSLANVIG